MGDQDQRQSDQPMEAESLEQAKQSTSPFEERWTPLTMDALTKEPKPHRYLLTRLDKSRAERKTAGVLVRGKLAMLAGAGASGKTAALCRLALAVALGRRWLGEWAVPEAEAGRVLLVLGEEDAEEVQRRLYRAAKAMKLSPEDLERASRNIVTVPLMGRSAAVLTDDWRPTEALTLLRSKLDADAGERGWALLAFDPFARFAPMDAEKDQVGATRMLAVFESLAEVKGSPTVIVAHHTSQASRVSGGDPKATDVRGVTAITDNARAVLAIQKERIGEKGQDVRIQRLRITGTKANYTPDPPTLYCTFDDWGAVRDETAAERAEREELQNVERPGKRTRKNSGVEPEPAASPASAGLPRR